VDAGSLTAASETLGLSAPAVVRALAALEREVGVRLLHRTTRRSSLSDEGREYFEQCRRVLAEVEAAEASLQSRRVEPKGRLRITAPVMFGRLHVAPVVTEFLARHAGVEAELTLLDRVVDLVEEGIDVAFRIGNLPESSLVAVSIGETRRVVCASPDYLKRAGTPVSPADLARHRCIVFAGLTPGNEWAFAGKPFARVPVRPFLRTNQFDVAMTAVRQGLGCARFLAYQVEAMLAAKEVRRILVRFEPEPVPVQVVYPHARLLSPNVRAFVDLAVARLRPVGRKVARDTPRERPRTADGGRPTGEDHPPARAKRGGSPV
jgi:DNA-binding transcriptional LysR family regulator